jgi:hypothetical protein
LRVRGGAPGSALAVLHATWPIPDAIPLEWGTTARANLAHMLWRLGASSLRGLPVSASLGVQGTTTWRVPVDPHACFAVALTPLGRPPAQLTVNAEVGAARRQSSIKNGELSAGLTVCAQERDELTLQVQGAGPGLTWLLGMWELGVSEQ